MTPIARAVSLACAALALAWAAELRADEPKTWRWVGEDGHVYTTTTPPPNGRGAIESPSPAAPAKARPKLAAKPVPGDGGDLCDRYSDSVVRWRYAKQSVESAEQYLDALNSSTDDYVRQNDSYHFSQVDSATRRLESAEAELDRIESDLVHAGVPQNCLTN